MDYSNLASADSVEKTVTALKANGFEPTVVGNKTEVLEKIKSFIPADASVMNGASRTLEEIGYIDYLKSGTHGWKNLHAAIVTEADPAKQSLLRREALLADYYLGSVHALTETGEMVIASNTGSQLPHIVYSSPNLILVVSTQKIVPTLSDALDRLEKQVIPLEDERMKAAYGIGTQRSKTLLYHKENSFGGRKVHVLLVKEKLGF